MLASSFFDPMLGIDIHWELVPMPAPTPTPIPNPFIGIVKDFTGLAAGIAVSNAIGAVMGASFKGPVMYWGGFPATNTGTEGVHVPGHILIPPGTGWAPVPKTPKPQVREGETPGPPKPVSPDDDAIIVFGSKTVSVMGSNAVRIGDMALSCSEPVRLPSSVVLAVPKGAPILIGGPPSLDIMAAIMASLRTRFMSDSLHAIISRLSPGRFRNLLHRAACFLTGHPVDVASGKVITESTDVDLLGPVPLRIERVYTSSSASRPGVLGYGWSHTLDQAIWEERGKVVYLAEDGREIEFDVSAFPEHRMQSGQQLWHPIHQLNLKRDSQSNWTLQTHDGRKLSFAPVGTRSSQRALLRRISHRGGQPDIELSYDNKGRLELVRDTDSALLRFEHDVRDHLVAVKLPLTRGHGWYTHRQYTYDDDDNLIRVRDSNGACWSYEYSGHLLVRETNRNGLNFFFMYDGLGEDAYCIRTWGDNGIFDHCLAYDKAKGITYVTNSKGQTTRYFANVAGAITKVVDPLGGERHIAYDAHLRRVGDVDESGGTHSYEYDLAGNLTKVTLPDGATVRAKFRCDGLIAQLTDAMGGIWTWDYDGTGCPTEERSPTSETQRYGWSSGRLAWFEPRTGGRVSCTYENHGKTLKMEGGGGAPITLSFDNHGRVIASQVGNGPKRELVWDSEGRLRELRTRTATLLRREYDPEGNLTLETSTHGETKHRIGHCNRAVTTSINNRLLHVVYDAEGLVYQVRREGSVPWTFERDACGRIVRETDPHGSWIEYRRDVAGRVTRTRRSSGRFTETEYDIMGRLTAAKHSDGTFATYAYRSDGMLLKATNESCTLLFDRDILGRTLRETVGHSEVVSAFDCRGLRSNLSTNHGWHTSISYDEVGLLSEQHMTSPWRVGNTHPDVAFYRTEEGNESARTLGGVIHLKWDRDDEGQPTAQHLIRRRGSTVVVAVQSYRWRGLGLLSGMSDSTRGSRDIQSDAFGRVVKDGWNAQIIHRAPNSRGTMIANRTQSVIAEDARGLLQQLGETRLTYDSDGYRTCSTTAEGDITKYEWNGHGDLVAVCRPDGVRVEFEYDPLSRRTAKRIVRNSREHGRHIEKEIRYVWDGNQIIHELEDEAVRRTWHWAPNSFDLLGFDQDGQRYFVTEDLTGSLRTIYDAAGVVRGEQEIDAFGKEHSARGRDLPWRLTGQYFDEETDLSYARWRYFDADSATFISPDPIGIGGGMDVYGYGDSPTLNPDPFGLGEGNYRQWQIHSTGYDDVVQKGLHFYGPGGLELSVRPTHNAGITFTNAIPNDAANPRLAGAIREAAERFERNPRWRREILAKATEGVRNTINFAGEFTGSLRDLAIGRSRELREIQRNIERREGRPCT